MSVHDNPRGPGYVVRWREGSRQRGRTFRYKTDADAFDRLVMRRRQLGPAAVEQLSRKGDTLAMFVEHRWAPEHAAGLEAKTRTGYSRLWSKHIEPTLGHVPLMHIDVHRIRGWQRDLLADKVTPTSIIKARTVLSSVLRYAAEEGAIPSNPLLLVRRPRVAQPDDVIPASPAEVERMRSMLPLRHATIVSVLAYSGLRPSEMRALRWTDIRDNTLRVQSGTDLDGARKATKNRRGRRTVRLVDPLRGDLAAWRAARKPVKPGDRVFPSTGADGGMTEPAWNDWRRHVFTPVRKAAGTQITRPYDLRHSFASLLLAEGRSIHYVADQLGHDAKLTLSTYGHLIDEFAERDDRIDITHEINQARQAAAGWTPAEPPQRVRVGAGQARVLSTLAARTAPVELDHKNERRAAASLAARGYVTATDGDRRGSRYAITDAGRDLHQQQRPGS